MSDSALDVEIELIESSLLPAEHLETSLDNGTRTISISSQDSDLNIRVTIAVVTYPTAESVKVEIRGANDGRDEAEGWRQWVSERMKDWSTEDEHPLFQILTDELLPLLAPTTAPSSPKQPHQENGAIVMEEPTRLQRFRLHTGLTARQQWLKPNNFNILSFFRAQFVSPTPESLIRSCINLNISDGIE